MKFEILSSRSATLGMLLCCCIILGLLAALPAAAQSDGSGLTRVVLPMSDESNDYAEIAFILPSEVNVTADTLKVLNYTEGREVKGTILLNGSRVGLYLLYPCQAPQTLLESEALKSLLAASDSSILQANYSDTLLGISGRPAIWGLMANQVFAAYQPTNQTAAVIVMDGSLPEETMTDFLGNLTITPNEGVSPLMPGYEGQVPQNFIQVFSLSKLSSTLGIFLSSGPSGSLAPVERHAAGRAYIGFIQLVQIFKYCSHKCGMAPG